MNLFTFLREAADAFPERPAIAFGAARLTFGELLRASIAAGHFFRSHGSRHAVLLDVNSLAIPIVLFGAAAAGIPYVPLNYRKTDAELNALIRRASPAIIIGDESTWSRITHSDADAAVSRDVLLRAARGPSTATVEPSDDGSRIAVQLFTSGTTGAPRAAILRHDPL